MAHSGDISKFDNITQTGIYMSAPTNGDSYGVLVVYFVASLSGGIVQQYFHPTEGVLIRIKNANNQDTWAEIKHR